jgi:S-layer family protein
MVVCRMALCAAIALALAPSVAAQIPVGSEFRVDTGGVEFPSQGFPTSRAIAMTPAGGFVAAWTTPSDDVAARRFGPGGSPIGAEFIVNSPTAYDSYAEQIATDDAGNFVVVWKNGRASGEIFGQRFGASGNRIGSEFQVNQDTLGWQFLPALAMAPSGEFVIAWSSSYSNSQRVVARRFDSTGTPVGGDFQVHIAGGYGYAAGDADVAMDGTGNFVIVWGAFNNNLSVRGQRFDAAGARQGAEFLASTPPRIAVAPSVDQRRDGSFVLAWVGDDAVDDAAVFARRYDASGQAVGAEFRMNAYTTGNQRLPSVAAQDDGSFLAVWSSNGQDGDDYGIFARAFDESGVGGPEFRVNTETSGRQWSSAVAGNASGNLVIVWANPDASGSDGQKRGQLYASRLMPAALSVDPSAGPTSDGNGVFEAGEEVEIAPSWSNMTLGAQSFAGTATTFTGPGTAGNPSYTIVDANAGYGPVASGATTGCSATGDCYALGITIPAVRPAAHWDAVFREEIAPGGLADPKDWTLHVGESFADVPRSHPFYRFVETLLHNGVTAGCRRGDAASYCPDGRLTRAQMAPLVLLAKEGPSYLPPPCDPPRMFQDVPASDPFCRWIEELARRNVITGCGPQRYCPNRPITREELAVVLVKTLDPAVVPPPCVPPNLYPDVPETSPYCPWIEELAGRGMVADCGGGNYCPADPTRRDEMAEFLTVSFGLTLYGV